MSVEITRSFALRMLSLEEGFTASELKAAYLKKAKIYHPDAGGSHEEFLNPLLNYSATSLPLRVKQRMILLVKEKGSMNIMNIEKRA